MTDDAARERAKTAFRKEEQAREGAKAWLEYEAERRATQEKTARLRALRLAKESVAKETGDATLVPAKAPAPVKAPAPAKARAATKARSRAR